MPGATRIAIDIGGTFTDIVLARGDGEIATRKVPSTPEDYSEGILRGVTELLELTDVTSRDVDDVIHATTVAANTIIEQKGARTALLTTRGFRDVLEMRRLRIPTLYDLGYHKPPPLVRRRDRHEVVERLGPDGQVWEELDEGSVRSVAAMLREHGIEAVAVSLLHAYANPDHELRVVELLTEELGEDVYVSWSSDVLPEIREYERTSTTVVNAYIAPVVRRYLGSLERRLAAAGRRRRCGSCSRAVAPSTVGGAISRPAHIIESGPAAGVVGAARLARLTRTDNMISLDMGGTTAKTAIIEQGQPVTTSEYEVGGGVNLSSQLIKGGGYAVKLPYIDVSEIGAGGGSIIELDDFGADPRRTAKCGGRSRPRVLRARWRARDPDRRLCGARLPQPHSPHRRPDDDRCKPGRGGARRGAGEAAWDLVRRGSVRGVDARRRDDDPGGQGGLHLPGS